MIQLSHLVLSVLLVTIQCLSVSSFAPVASFHKQAISNTQLHDGNGTGGWGIGGSREMVPEEFARGDRRYFDGYQMREQGDFRRQIQDDKEALKKSELEELLGVAKIAGIKVKNPKDRLYKFEQGALDDDDSLDLSV